MKDYYYIMGVEKGASKEDIKKAYRKLSVKFHPDKNDGDSFFEERFKEINEAYEILSNDENRRLYDLSLSLSNIDIDKLYDEDDANENSSESEQEIHVNEPTSVKFEEVVNNSKSFLHYWGVVCVIAYVIAALNAFIFNWWDASISAGIAFGAGLFGWYADTKIKKLDKSNTELSR